MVCIHIPQVHKTMTKLRMKNIFENGLEMKGGREMKIGKVKHIKIRKRRHGSKKFPNYARVYLSQWHQNKTAQQLKKSLDNYGEAKCIYHNSLYWNFKCHKDSLTISFANMVI